MRDEGRNSPMGSENHGTRGLGRCRDVAKGNGTRAGKGGQKRQVTAPWDWEISRHGVVNHGPTMESQATGSREDPLNSRMAVRCWQGSGLTLRSQGQWPKYT